MPTIKRRSASIRDLVADARETMTEIKPKRSRGSSAKIDRELSGDPPKARFKKIEQHSREELEAAINTAVDRFGSDFWLLLHGIDSYMERRKRLKIERNDAMMKLIHNSQMTNWRDP